MKEEDEEHTSFITPYGVFCYKTMPFGLKNAGATYQRMMQACLKEQIGRNVQVYVDDIVIKTYKAATLLDDLRETFAALNKYRIKLNQRSAHSVYRQGSCLATWSLPEESRRTLRKSKPSPECKNQLTSKEYNSSLEDSQP